MVPPRRLLRCDPGLVKHNQKADGCPQAQFFVPWQFCLELVAGTVGGGHSGERQLSLQPAVLGAGSPDRPPRSVPPLRAEAVSGHQPRFPPAALRGGSLGTATCGGSTGFPDPAGSADAGIDGGTNPGTAAGAGHPGATAYRARCTAACGGTQPRKAEPAVFNRGAGRQWC